MAIIDYDKSPQITEAQRLKSLKESVQRAFDEVDNSAIPNKEIDALPMNKTASSGGGSGSGGSTDPVFWNDIIGKPSTFYPAEHTHVCKDITDMGSISNQDIDDAITNLEIEALINNMA